MCSSWPQAYAQLSSPPVDSDPCLSSFNHCPSPDVVSCFHSRKWSGWQLVSMSQILETKTDKHNHDLPTSKLLLEIIVFETFLKTKKKHPGSFKYFQEMSSLSTKLKKLRFGAR